MLLTFVKVTRLRVFYRTVIKYIAFIEDDDNETFQASLQLMTDTEYIIVT